MTGKVNKKDVVFSAQIILGLVTFLFTVVIVLQIRTHMLVVANQQGIQAKEKASEIKQKLDEAIANNNELRFKIDELTKEYNSKINALGDQGIEKEIKDLSDKLAEVQIIAGLTNVRGQGITIKMSDVPNPDLDLDAENTIIHSYYVYETINDLRRAGAQAIAINGERIISMSEQMCAGATIRVNGKRFIYPYVITAIGDKDKLYNALNSSPLLNYLMSEGFDINITKNDDLIIYKYNGNVDMITNMMKAVD